MLTLIIEMGEILVKHDRREKLSIFLHLKPFSISIKDVFIFNAGNAKLRFETKLRIPGKLFPLFVLFAII